MACEVRAAVIRRIVRRRLDSRKPSSGERDPENPRWDQEEREAQQNLTPSDREMDKFMTDNSNSCESKVEWEEFASRYGIGPSKSVRDRILFRLIMAEIPQEEL